ncbi:MAG: ABC transporter permease [Leptospira sp.]|nr:ABC transporter permease [Leptospira sp.]
MFSLDSYTSFISDVAKNRRLLYELAKQDFRQRFVGNFLGVTWAFVNPIIQVSILWFVFSVGFRAKPVGETPYIYWLLAGFFPWLHLSESIIAGTNCIIEKPYLVKKVVFRVSTLPIVKLASVSVIHTFFFMMMLFVYLINGIGDWKYKLQLLYYLFCLFSLTLTVTWITSAIVVFIRDIGQIVSISIQFGFWLTPVFWNADMIPPKYSYLMNFNPANYIVSGYRDSLLGGRWFYEKELETLIFWSTTFVFLLIGMYVFKRLRMHFADVI